MKSTWAKLSTMIALALVFGGCITTGSTSGRASNDGPVQILETDELMKILMDPIYENLKDWIEIAPEGRKAWRGLYVAAFSLAEISNLMYSRTGDEYSNNPEWRQLVTEARDITIGLAESVRNQDDYETLKNHYRAVVETCNKCHSVFNTEDPPAVDVPRAWTK